MSEESSRVTVHVSGPDELVRGFINSVNPVAGDGPTFRLGQISGGATRVSTEKNFVAVLRFPPHVSEETAVEVAENKLQLYAESREQESRLERATVTLQ